MKSKIKLCYACHAAGHVFKNCTNEEVKNNFYKQINDGKIDLKNLNLIYNYRTERNHFDFPISNGYPARIPHPPTYYDQPYFQQPICLPANNLPYYPNNGIGFLNEQDSLNFQNGGNERRSFKRKRIRSKKKRNKKFIKKNLNEKKNLIKSSLVNRSIDSINLDTNQKSTINQFDINNLDRKIKRRKVTSTITSSDMDISSDNSSFNSSSSSDSSFNSNDSRSKEESSKKEGLEEGSKEEGSEEGSKEGSTEEGSKEEGSEGEGSKEEGSKEEGSKEEGSEGEGSEESSEELKIKLANNSYELIIDQNCSYLAKNKENELALIDLKNLDIHQKKSTNELNNNQKIELKDIIELIDQVNHVNYSKIDDLFLSGDQDYRNIHSINDKQQATCSKYSNNNDKNITEIKQSNKEIKPVDKKQITNNQINNKQAKNGKQINKIIEKLNECKLCFKNVDDNLIVDTQDRFYAIMISPIKPALENECIISSKAHDLSSFLSSSSAGFLLFKNIKFKMEVDFKPRNKKLIFSEYYAKHENKNHFEINCLPVDGDKFEEIVKRLKKLLIFYKGEKAVDSNAKFFDDDLDLDNLKKEIGKQSYFLVLYGDKSGFIYKFKDEDSEKRFNKNWLKREFFYFLNCKKDKDAKLKSKDMELETYQELDEIKSRCKELIKILGAKK